MSRVAQDLLHPFGAVVESRQRELDFQVVLEGQIEEGVDAVLAERRGDLGDRPALERLERRRAHLVHGDARPVRRR